MRVDLHVHSVYSDGASHPQDICYMAAERGTRAVVTDHDTVAGQIAMLKTCPEYTLHLYAMERTRDVCIEVDGKCFAAHVNVYCPNPFSASEVPPRVQDMRDWADRNGCILQWNHPFFWLHKVKPWEWKALVREGTKLADMVEVWNGNSMWVQNMLYVWIASGKIALSKEDVRDLAVASPKAWSAGSDAHLPWLVASASTWFDFESPSFDAFADAVQRAKSVPAEMGGAGLCDKAMMLSRWHRNRVLDAVVKLCSRKNVKGWWDPFSSKWELMQKGLLFDELYN